MKYFKFIIAFCIVLVGFAHANAAENIMYINDTVVKPGEQTTLSIILDNETPISMAEFILTLPEGIEFEIDEELAVIGELNESRSVDQMLFSKIQNGQMNVAKFLIDSSYLKNFNGNSGEILKVTINVSEEFTGSAKATLTGVDCVTGDAEGVDMPETEFTITAELNTYKLSILDVGGAIVIDVKEGKSFDCTLTPSDQWKVSSVLLNNEDVTSNVAEDGVFSTGAIYADATLRVVYEQIESDAVAAISLNKVSIMPTADGVYVVGAKDNSTVIVSDVNGVNVYLGQSKFIPLSKKGVYILGVEGRNFKFVH